MSWLRTLDKHTTMTSSETKHVTSMEAETPKTTNGHVAESQSPGRKSEIDDGPSGLTPIAIVGMGCRLSGNVSSLEEFWEMVCRGRQGWSEIPEHRFSAAAYSHPNAERKGAFNARGGYFLENDPAMFDAPFFNITRAEAEAMGMSLSKSSSDNSQILTPSSRPAATTTSRVYIRSS